MTHSSKMCVTQQDLDQNHIINGRHEDSELQCMTQVISNLTQTRDRADIPCASHLHYPHDRRGENV